jgi:hypothetical protein
MLPRMGVAMVAAVTLAIVPGAAATVKSAGGIKYVTKAVDVKGKARATGVARCPRHTHVLGGGERNTGGFGSIRLNQTFPKDASDPDSRPDDGWGVRVRNGKSKRRTVKVQAICAKTKVSYVQVRFVAPASTESDEVEASCPPGTHAYSGGVGGPRKSPIYPNSSFPASPSGTGATKWGAYVDNRSATAEQNATIFAVCGASQPAVVTATVQAVPIGTQGGRAPHCPSGKHAVGGGLSTTGGYKDVEINTLSPVTVAGKPGAGWRALVDVTFPFAPQVTVYAVCRS